MTRFRPGLWVTLVTMICLLVLFGLGQWQLERRVWKQTLLQEIASRTQGPPVSLPATIKNPKDWRYRLVTVTGRFDHSAEMAVIAGRGFHIITPLLRDGDKDPVLVVRGYVPAEYRDPESRRAGQVSDEVTVTALARLAPRPNIFIPDNRPDEDIWYWRDLDAMVKAAGLERVVPLFLEATENAPGGWPEGGVTRLDIPDNHLQYALTWFALAVALLVIYLIFGFRRAQDL